MSRLLFLVICLLAPIATLRWPLPILLATLSGVGAVDRTVVVFLAPVALMLLGYPGYATAVMSRPEQSLLRRSWIIASILAVLIASLLILLWMLPTVLRMGSTLRDPLQNVFWVTPPLLTVVCSILIRLRFRPGQVR